MSSPFQFLSKDSADFRVIPIELIMVSSFQIGSVQILAEVDPVALEPVESFFLTIEIIGSTIPADAFDSKRTLNFLNNRIEVLIEDASG